ncbi:MAG: Bug family tripartite tricarboxylate transporter substrate binding protein [Gemmatimonas sp.]
MRRSTASAWCVASLAALAVLATTAARAQDGSQSFKGKQIRLYVGSSTGGGYDTFARVIAAHMPRHIPGQPTIMVQNMPGAGSLVLANHVYNLGPRDGTEIGAVNPQISLDPMFHPDRVKFDPRRFNWIGSALTENHVGVAWHTTTVRTFDDAFKEQLVVAGSGGSTDTYPDFTNGLLGTKFKVVSGYKGTKEGMLAMERGEVTGNVGITWASLKATGGEWLKSKQVRVFIQFGLSKHPELPDVSWIYDYARNDDDRAAMDLLLGPQEFGRPYIVPPDVPAPIVATLRRAFDETMKDPAFLSEAEKRQLDIDPVGGEAIQQILEKMYRAPPAVVEKVRQFVDKS